MTLLVLFRTRLEWCNYTCHYCPWNATLNRVEGEAFREDERRLTRIVERIAELPRAVELFITPKAEYLVLPYWRDAVGRLLALPQVERVTVQTNLSFDVAAWLEEVDHGKLALWTTYHPTEVDAAGLVGLHAKWALLRRRGVPFSVGVVGTRENIPHAEALRARLPGDVYLWVNAYKREPDYYALGEVERVRAIDPYFDLNNQHGGSAGGGPRRRGRSAAVLLRGRGDRQPVPRWLGDAAGAAGVPQADVPLLCGAHARRGAGLPGGVRQEPGGAHPAGVAGETRPTG
jgi:hypothetical protein